MQSGSWYLGTPGMTVTSLAPLPCGAGGSSRRCVVGRGLARRQRRVVSATLGGAGCRPLVRPARPASPVRRRQRLSRHCLRRRCLWRHGLRLPPRPCRRNRLGDVGDVGDIGGVACLGDVGLLIGLAGLLVRLVVLEPRVASRPVIVVGVDVRWRRLRPPTWSMVSVPPAFVGSALALSVRVRAAGSSTGWFSRSNQVGATGPDPARAVGDGALLGGARSPTARGNLAGAAPGCGAFGGDALGFSLGAQIGLTWSPDDHGGCGERVCQSAAASPSGAGAWPKAVRRCANGGFPNGELSAARPTVGELTVGELTVGVVIEGAAAVDAATRAWAAAAASNAAVAGPGTCGRVCSRPSRTCPSLPRTSPAPTDWPAGIPESAAAPAGASSGPPPKSSSRLSATPMASATSATALTAIAT